MAINIFSGGSSAKGSSSSSAPKASTAAIRAAASTAAVGAPAGNSSSGNTAVASGGIMGKVGGFLNKVSGLASLIPGPIGHIGSIVNGLTSNNDPEWWSSIKGDGLTTNDPLQTISMGSYAVFTNKRLLAQVRPAFLEFISAKNTSIGGSSVPTSMIVDDRMVTQYLMPQVRKVINAVTLQDASDYGSALEVNASIYALWRTLQKWDFLLKHGQTFLPTLADGAFPMLTNTSAAFLQSTITRLEEYLRANVRLPHTLCEYLTWRYGRIFRTNASAKAGFVFYDYQPLNVTQVTLDATVTSLLSKISSSPAIQKASSDLYNAYLAHDQEVLLTEESQAAYDCKEFVLRTNLDLISTYDPLYTGITDSVIMMDSNLDNPTTFMASTVSCYVDDGTGNNNALFPVDRAVIYFYDTVFTDDTQNLRVLLWTDASTDSFGASVGQTISPSSHWKYLTVTPFMPNATAFSADSLSFLTVYETLSKSMDLYNVGLFLPVTNKASGPGPDTDLTGMIDISAISIDAGSVSDVVIRNEQVFAFANLVNEDATSKATYKQVEKRVAADVADFVEHTDVATLAPTASK